MRTGVRPLTVVLIVLTVVAIALDVVERAGGAAAVAPVRRSHASTRQAAPPVVAPEVTPPAVPAAATAEMPSAAPDAVAVAPPPVAPPPPSEPTTADDPAVPVGAAAPATDTGPEPSPSPPACAEVASPLVLEVLEGVNALRAEHGVGALRWDGQLGCLAAEWAGHLAGVRALEHRDLLSVLRSDGWFRWVTLGENLAAGGTVMDARTILNLWLTSPAHAATMLSPRYEWTGLAVASMGDLLYVVQNFGVLR